MAHTFLACSRTLCPIITGNDGTLGNESTNVVVDTEKPNEPPAAQSPTHSPALGMVATIIQNGRQVSPTTTRPVVRNGYVLTCNVCFGLGTLLWRFFSPTHTRMCAAPNLDLQPARPSHPCWLHRNCSSPHWADPHHCQCGRFPCGPLSNGWPCRSPVL